MSVDVDDTDSAIVYSGSWSAVTGSTRQHDSTIHSTTQNGAAATIKFYGTRIIVYQTVPMGNTTETVNSNLDGALGSMSRESHSGTAYYQDIWFDSGPITLDDHTLIVSNGGGPSDTPFELDYFHIEGSVITPASSPTSTTVSPQKTAALTTTTTWSSSSTSSSSASSSTSSASTSISSTLSSNSTTSSQTQSSGSAGSEKTITAIQYITTSADGSISTSTPDQTVTATSKSHIGPIVGAAIGALALILLLLLGLCLRRRRQRRKSANTGSPARTRRMTDVTPYDLEINASRHSLMRNPSQEMAMTNSSNSRPLAISTSISNSQNSGDRDPLSSANGGSKPDTYPSEKNRDLFSDWTTPASHPYATASPINEASSPSSIPIASGESDDGLSRPRYLSGDTLQTPNHVFNDHPPSYRSIRDRNSNISSPSPFS